MAKSTARSDFAISDSPRARRDGPCGRLALCGRMMLAAEAIPVGRLNDVRGWMTVNDALDVAKMARTFARKASRVRRRRAV